MADDNLIRMIFPPLLTRKGTFKKKQSCVFVRCNGETVKVRRGVVVLVPLWVKEVLDHVPQENLKYLKAECFVSSRPPTKE